jgi:DNA-binding CsgD family transcriptional regulator
MAAKYLKITRRNPTKEKTVTRIIVILAPEFCATYTIDDPRSPRELAAAINTGKYIVGEGEFYMECSRQWAMLHRPLQVITVVLEPPPVELSPRQYDVLYGLSDGKDAAQIAAELNITTRTVYALTAALKERFGVNSKEEMLTLADSYGFIE